MNVHGKAEERREDNIRSGVVLASLDFALPEPKKTKSCFWNYNQRRYQNSRIKL